MRTAAASNADIRAALGARHGQPPAWTGHATGALPEERWEPVRAGLVRGGVPAETPTSAHLNLEALIHRLTGKPGALEADVLARASRWAQQTNRANMHNVRCQLWGLDVRSARNPVTGELIDAGCVLPAHDRALITATQLSTMPLLVPMWLLRFYQAPAHAAITRVSPPTWQGADPGELGAGRLNL